MKESLLILCLAIISLNIGYAQCGIVGMQSQLLQDASFPIQNTSAIPASVKIINGNYPTTIGVEDSNTSGISNARNFSPNESGNIVPSITTGLGVYEVELRSLAGCIDTIEVAVVLTLPVEWLKPLSARQRNNSIEISFSTAHQINNDHFEIERSTDGRHYKKIGAIKGAGTTSNDNRYLFLDESPEIGNNYYRIKQVDYDGNYDYSNIASLFFEGEETKIFPNPFTHEINIRSTSQQAIMIYDPLGKLLRKTEGNKGENRIDLSELPSGMYYLNVGDKTEIIIKQ